MGAMKRWSCLVATMLTLASLIACNGSSSSKSSGPSMSGFWNGTFGTGVAFTMDIDQSGDALTGSYSSGGLDGTLTGSISSNDVMMTVTLSGSGAVSEFTGLVDAGRTIMAGTFKIIAGGGGSGQWSATKQ